MPYFKPPEENTRSIVPVTKKDSYFSMNANGMQTGDYPLTIHAILEVGLIVFWRVSRIRVVPFEHYDTRTETLKIVSSPNYLSEW